MIDTLVHAYTPLLLWTGLGLLLFRFIPTNFPKLLARSLYWVGVPLQIGVLARQTDFSGGAGLIPAVAIGVLLLSMGFAWASWHLLKWFTSYQQTEPAALAKTSNSFFSSSNLTSFDRSSQGSFILAAMLGNTGFVGLAIALAIVNAKDTNWAVLYSLSNNVIGTYGIGVFVASYFGHSDAKQNLWVQLKDVMTVPSLWAFFLGFLTQNIEIPQIIVPALDASVKVVIASALFLVGIRLGSVQGWQNLKLAAIPTLLKVFIVPLIVGLSATYFGLTGDPRLSLVLMSGTPTALAVLILAEVYNLNRELLASNIVMTSVGLLLVFPLWLSWFG